MGTGPGLSGLVGCAGLLVHSFFNQPADPGQGLHVLFPVCGGNQHNAIPGSRIAAFAKNK